MSCFLLLSNWGHVRVALTRTAPQLLQLVREKYAAQGLLNMTIQEVFEKGYGKHVTENMEKNINKGRKNHCFLG